MYFHKSSVLRIAAVYLALFGTVHLSFSQGIPDNRFGFVGDGGLPLAQKFGLEYYTLEGNHCRLVASGTCEGNPALSTTLPSSLNPTNDPPQNPIAHKVVREVAKLNVRNDALGENQDYLTTKLKRFTERRMNYYARFQIGKKPTFSWYAPNAQNLINAEAPQIRATIQRENAASPAVTGTIWEIGNEPNFYPAITPAQYAGVYNQYRTVIKNESPTALVALGALFVNELVLPSLRNQASEIIFARGADEFDKRNGPVKLIALVAMTTAAGAGIGAAIGSAGGPIGALLGFGIGALIGVHVTRATNRAIRDARSLIVNRLFGKSTTTYFRELVSAIPTTSPPDFISLHAYPFDDKQPFYTPQEINQILNSVSIELQDIAQARFGVRPPVLVTEFGNINFNKTNPTDVAAMAAGMISNFEANSPGIYRRWFWYKGIGQDEQFTVFSGEGINPPMTRLISDVDARPTDGNFSCDELNAIGETYYLRALGTPCVDPPGSVFPALPKITRDSTPGVIFESQRKASEFPEIGRYLRIDYTIPTNQSNFSGTLRVSAIEQTEIGYVQTSLTMPNENRVQYQVLELPESILSALNDTNRSITIVVKVLGQGKIYVTDISLSREYPLITNSEVLPVTGDPINIFTFSEESTFENFAFESVKSWELDSLNGNKFLKSNDLGDEDIAVLQETFRTEADASLHGGYTAQFDVKYPGIPGSSNVNPTNFVSMTLLDTLGNSSLEVQFRPFQTGSSGDNIRYINHKTSTTIVSSPAVATDFGAAGNGGWNNIRMKVRPIASGGFNLEVAYGLNGIFTMAPVISTTLTSIPILESMSLKHQTGLGGSHLAAQVDNIGLRYNQGAPALIAMGISQNLITPMSVKGDAFFSEKTHFNSGASGSEFIGDVVILDNGSGQAFSTDARLIFRQSLFAASKFKAQNSGLTLAGAAGFGSQLEIPLGISGKSGLLFNSDIIGNGTVSLSNTPVLHSGSASPTRISGYSQMTNVGSALPIADRLYLRRSTPPSFNLDFSAIPASKIIAVSSLGAITSIKGKDLDTYYRGISQNALHNGYLVVLVDQPLSFQWDSAIPTNNEFLGKVIFIVDSQLHVNGQLYTSMGRSRTVIAVRNNGVVNGMASPGRFQGYIHVKDSGTISYQPGPESEFIGAIHHTGVSTGMQINGSGSMDLFFDQAVLADLERIGVLSSAY